MAEMPADVKRIDNLPIPQGTKPLMHQVAGHVFGRKNKIGFLQSDDGYILKPVQGSGKGERELDFYKRVFSPTCSDPVLLELQKYLPLFYGTWTAPEHPGQLFIKLEDITRKFRCPCIMDVKIGPVTYDLKATPDKIKREKSKFPALEDVGFQLGGVKRCSMDQHSSVTLDRTFLRALDKQTVLTKGIAAFFDSGKAFQPALINAFLRRLSVIESWFNSQTKLQFFASSLLLVYDGEALSSVSVPTAPVIPNGDHQSLADRNRVSVASSADTDTSVSLENGGHISTNSDPRSVKEMSTRNGLLCDRNSLPAEPCTSHDDAWYDEHVDVRMIDFAHVFPSDAIDSNYLVGLHSLVSYFKQLTPNTYDP